jgi:hypothetical protein
MYQVVKRVVTSGALMTDESLKLTEPASVPHRQQRAVRPASQPGSSDGRQRISI